MTERVPMINVARYDQETLTKQSGLRSFHSADAAADYADELKSTPCDYIFCIIEWCSDEDLETVLREMRSAAVW